MNKNASYVLSVSVKVLPARGGCSRILCNGPTSGHSGARQSSVWRLWENTFNKGQNAAQDVRSEEKSMRNNPAGTKEKEKEEVL